MTDSKGALVRGRGYPYPVGEKPDGMNTSGRDRWPRHATVGATKRAVNGLYDMGGNVWEWLADRWGDEALTAGGSWWYGADQTQASAVEWKSADFYAVYRVSVRLHAPTAGTWQSGPHHRIGHSIPPDAARHHLFVGLDMISRSP